MREWFRSLVAPSVREFTSGYVYAIECPCGHISTPSESGNACICSNCGRPEVHSSKVTGEWVMRGTSRWMGPEKVEVLEFRKAFEV